MSELINLPHIVSISPIIEWEDINYDDLLLAEVQELGELYDSIDKLTHVQERLKDGLKRQAEEKTGVRRIPAFDEDNEVIWTWQRMKRG